MVLHVALWIVQILLSLYVTFTGVTHFTVPAGLPEQYSWMYDLSPALHWFSGTAEILIALGLILPAATRIKPRLTSLAGAGLVAVMLGAIVFHLQRGEFINIGTNVVLAAAGGFVAYGRWSLRSISERGKKSGEG